MTIEELEKSGFKERMKTWCDASGWFGVKSMWEYTSERFEKNVDVAVKIFNDLVDYRIDGFNGNATELWLFEKCKEMSEPIRVTLQSNGHFSDILYGIIYVYGNEDCVYWRKDLQVLEQCVEDAEGLRLFLDKFKTRAVASVSLSPEDGDGDVDGDVDDEIICIDSDYDWLCGATLEKKKENAEMLRMKMRQWYDANHKRGCKENYLLRLKVAYFDSRGVIKRKPSLKQYNKIFGDIFTIGKDTLGKWRPQNIDC